MTDAKELLREYARKGSEAAFRELVSRYVDLVYSAAFRLVNNDAHLAQDVTQTVFSDLARMAGKLSREVMLGGWLHRHTCFVASKTMRRERRRQQRERQSVEMNSMEDHAAANLQLVAPILDEAIDQLGTEDRQAIFLRFFEQKDFQSVGVQLGSSEEAARKRVNRALEKLEGLLKARGVALSAGALALALGTQAVTAAPVGMGVSVASTALAASAGGATALTFLELMGMTKIKAGIVAALTVAVAIPLVVQNKTNTKLRGEIASLRQQTEEMGKVETENKRLSNLLARASQPRPGTNEQFQELMKLRGEVGVLRQQKASEPPTVTKTEAASPLSDLTESPEMLKMIRDQQKMGMTMVYKSFAKRANLSTNQTEKLHDLLADNVMENINHITHVLKEGKTAQEMEAVFAAQEKVMDEKVRALLGEEAFAEYQDYNRNLASSITAEQFKGMLTGEKESKEANSKRMYEILQEEAQLARANAGLPADYQLVPSLNFRNFASEEEGEMNLQLLDGIYERFTTRATEFLTPAEVEKFAEFRKAAINNNRIALAVNRKMMGPAK